MGTNEETKPGIEAAAPVVVAEFEKNKKEKVRVALVEFQGHELLEIRAYFPAPDGTMRPGKGIAIQRTQIVTLRKALQEAERAIKDKKTTISLDEPSQETAEPIDQAA